MLSDKRKQILNIIGMLIMMGILVLSGIGQGTWNWCRITLFLIGFVGLIISVVIKCTRKISKDIL